MLRKPVEAVLFDMDGLLIDTEAVYIDAYAARPPRRWGVEMSLDLCHSMIGVPSRECKVMIQDHFGDGLQARRTSTAISTGTPADGSTPTSR